MEKKKKKEKRKRGGVGDLGFGVTCGGEGTKICGFV
jgi:hypothetical protein